jgi:rSAM/selenodomain-associated transferase 1
MDMRRWACEQDRAGSVTFRSPGRKQTRSSHTTATHRRDEEPPEPHLQPDRLSDPAPARCGIAVMAKASKAGRTKTRLSPPLTPQEAAAFNTAFLADIADNLLAAASTAGCSIAGYMAYGPPGEGSFFDMLPSGIGRFEAWRPHFGATLAGTIDSLFARGHASACVLNADSPTLPPAILTEAARILDQPGERAVLGPSTDGGYYLLGLKRQHMRLFEDITWSTEHVARQTLDRAAEIGLPVHLLPEWYDVDDAASMAILRGELVEHRPFGTLPSARARHTSALLARLEAEAPL